MITPDDVRSYIAFCLTAHKTSKTLYVNTIKKWIISRTSTVIKYHCFIMITLYCPNLLYQLKEQEMNELLNRMVQSVDDCLSYRLLFRKNSPGNRSSNWRNNNNPWREVPDGSEEIPTLTERDWKLLDQRLIYPRNVKFHFDIYEHEIRSFESFRYLHYADSESFISDQYMNGIHKSQVRSDIEMVAASEVAAITNETVDSNRVSSHTSMDDKKLSPVQKKHKSDKNTDISNDTVETNIVDKKVEYYQPRDSTKENITTVTVKHFIPNIERNEQGPRVISEYDTDISNLHSKMGHMEFLYNLIGLRLPYRLSDYDNIDPNAVKAGIYQAKKFLETCKTYLNEAKPRKKRVQYILSDHHREIAVDSDSADYDEIDSDAESFDQDYMLEQESKNKRFKKRNVDDFLNIVAKIPIIDMAFRTTYVTESTGSYLCPFHEKFLPIFNHVVPNDVSHAEIYHLRGCSEKKGQFANLNAFLQHCESSNNWQHMMLANYLKGTWAPGACTFVEPK